ncbi:hypothetical protein [Streptomyces aurantiogriseus]|uniref:Uncharacterized protein n=1 Tax=Streptomyces aurantiogriseus TaxID=66870 RepID=A0A918FDP3_9ACTN|nr:hypothetical protein [Streptomyces aurantiogriseus]GGR25688.1 hypothetical protein GCM10010251_47140 [Streptomyces aurantiogriseus]
MSDMDVGQLGSIMKLHNEQRNTWKTALIVGYDGGAALLNHARPQVFKNDLLLRVYRKVDRAWRSVLPDESHRSQWMVKHTSSPDGEPDAEALWCIARLVRDGYVHSIVATDNAGTFHRGLGELGVKMAKYECSENLPNVLPAKAKGPEPLFINAGEFLLYGCVPDVRGNGAKHVGEMLEALKSFLDEFDAVYCWGWCNLNHQLDSIFLNTNETLKVLGWYDTTETAIRITTNYDTVVCDGSLDMATTDILHRLADELFDNEKDPIPTAPRQPSAEPVLAAVPTTAPRPLLSDELLADLVANVQQYRISYIGVDGELTRRRCFEWLTAELSGRGRDVFVRTDSDIRVLGRLATTLSGLDDNIWFIGQLNGDGTADRTWLSSLLSYAQRWNGHGKGPKNERCDPASRIVLLLPAQAAGELQIALPPDGQTCIMSVFADSHLDQKTVVKYVDTTAGPPLAQLKTVEVMDLAERMIDQCRADSSSPLDWLHDTLDLWRRLIVSEIAARAPEEADSDHQPLLTIADLQRLWDEAGNRMTDAEVPLDFDLGPVHRREEDDPPEGDESSDDDPPDFDLGPATPRP